MANKHPYLQNMVCSPAFATKLDVAKQSPQSNKAVFPQRALPLPYPPNGANVALRFPPKAAPKSTSLSDPELTTSAEISDPSQDFCTSSASSNDLENKASIQFLLTAEAESSDCIDEMARVPSCASVIAPCSKVPGLELSVTGKASIILAQAAGLGVGGYGSPVDVNDIPKVSASLIRRFDCPHCERLFRQRRDLNKHIACVHLKQKPFSCDSCSMVFSHRGNLQQHIREVHEKLKPFVCKHCRGRFSRLGNLMSHIKRMHSSNSR